MKRSITLIISLGLVLMLVSACASWFITDDAPAPIEDDPLSEPLPEETESDMAANLFTVDDDVTVTGTVTGTIDDCAFDGNCALVLDVDGTEVNAIWAEGMLRCEGQYDDSITVGDTVEASGIARDGNSLSICPSADYYIRLAE